MSSKRIQDLEKLVRDQRRLVLDAKSSKRDRNLKGLLLHLKKEVLRNAEMAANFRQIGGVNVVCDALERHTTFKDSIVSLCLSLLANLAALDNDTKKNIATSRTCETTIQILEETQAADVVNCGCRLLGNIVHCIVPGSSNSDLHVRISKIMVYQIGTTEDANCKQSLLRTICILSQLPLYLAELLKCNVVCYLSRHLESKTLHLQLLQVFRILCDAEPEASLQLTHMDEFAQLVSLLADADSKIAKTATLILLRISEFPECRGDIGSSGGIEGLMSLLRTNRAREFNIHSEIMKALSLCCHDVLCRQKLKQTEGLSELIGELHSEAYAFDDPTVTCILSSLSCYYFDDPSLQFMVHRLNLVKVLGFRLNQMVLALDKRQHHEKNVGGGESVEGSSEKESRVGKPETVSVPLAETSSSDSESSNSPQDVEIVSEVESVAESPSPSPSSPRLSDSLPTSSDSSPSSSTTLHRDLAEESLTQGWYMSLQKPGPSFLPHRLANSPKLSGVFANRVSPFKKGGGEEEDFAEENCHNASMFEGILETLATSPPSSKRPGPLHVFRSADKFEHTPCNVIDSLLTAPSPYATSPPPTHPTPPSLHRESSTHEHPLFTLIYRLSFIPSCLPSLAQHCLLHPLMKFFSLKHGSNKRCYLTLNRIFKNHNCLSECILCHCAPYIWVNVCMQTCPIELSRTASYCESTSAEDSQDPSLVATATSDGSGDPAAGLDFTPSSSSKQQSAPRSVFTSVQSPPPPPPPPPPSSSAKPAAGPDPRHSTTPRHRHRAVPGSCARGPPSLSPMDALVLACNQSCSPGHFHDDSAHSDEFELPSLYVQWPKGASQILQSLASVAMSPFGTGLLEHLLQRGSAKEKMASALSVPFLISDTKVISKMMIGFEGFKSLAEIFFNHLEQVELFGFAVEALCMLLQRMKMKGQGITSPEAVGRSRRESHGTPRSREGVVNDIAQPTATPQIKDVTTAAATTSAFSFSPATCPYSAWTGPIAATVGSTHTEAPPAKRPRLESSSSCHNDCQYEHTLAAVPPDVSLSVDCEGNNMDLELEPSSLPATFMAHKSVLSSTSDVFGAMFSNSFRESAQSHVTLKTTSALAFKTLLHYVYGCRLNCAAFKNAVLLQEEATAIDCKVSDDQRHSIEPPAKQCSQRNATSSACLRDPREPPPVGVGADNALCGRTWNITLHVELLALSDQYFIGSLRQDCQNALSLSITSDNAVDLFSLACLHRADFVKFRCIEHIFSIGSHRGRAKATMQLLTSDNMANALSVIRDMTKCF